MNRSSLSAGLGTINRLKKKVNGTFNEEDNEPILLKDVFSVGPWWYWFFPWILFLKIMILLWAIALLRDC